MSDEFEAIRELFEAWMKDDAGISVYPIGMQGAIVGTLEKACGGKENRKLILKQLTGKTSSKDLSQGEWRGLYKLALPFKPEGGKWCSGNPDLESICNTILRETYAQPGQTTLFEYPEFANLNDSAANWEAHVENPVVQDDDIPF